MKKKLLFVILLSSLLSLYSQDAQNSEKKTAEEEYNFEINLWPLLSYQNTEEDKKSLSAFLIYNQTTSEEKGLESLQVLNFFHGENYNVFFPFYYGVNKESGYHFGNPIWFSGPDYDVVPIALWASWENSLEGQSTWFTPLYHSSTNKKGEIESLHLINYFYSKHNHVFFPLAWSFEAEKERHHGFIPVYAKGPDYWTVPFLLSWNREDNEGTESTWITPLFHKSENENKNISSYHFLNIYGYEDNYGSNFGIFPLWMNDDKSWMIPPILTWSNENPQGGRNTWVTPLFHRNTDDSGKTKDFHFLNVYGVQEDNDIWHKGTIPLWMSGPNYWIIPPLLTGGHSNDYSKTLWISPLYHQKTDNEGDLLSIHFINYYGYRNNEGWNQSFFPLWFEGPDYWAVPFALSGHWLDWTNKKHTWITPFFHLTHNKDNELINYHFMNFYGFENSKGRHSSIFPLWFKGNNYWLFTPLLSGGWTNSKNESKAWLTPFFHQSRTAEGDINGYHYLSFYGYKSNEGWKRGIAPFWYQGPDYWYSPVFLSGRWLNSAGGKTTFLSPLYHKSTDADNNTLHYHFMNYFAFRKNDSWNKSIFPVWFKGPRYWLMPIALSGGWEKNNIKENWFTPLAHTQARMDLKTQEYSLDKFHFINVYGSKNNNTWNWGIFPVYHKTENSWSFPILLTGRFKQPDNNYTETWISPLLHWESENSKLKAFHIATYFYWAENNHLLFPLAWLTGEKGSKHYAILPLFTGGPDYFYSPLGYGFGQEDNFHYGLFPVFSKGPDYLFIPPLLSGAWKKHDNSSTVWLTPLFHMNKSENREVENLHLINYIYTDSFSTLFPVYWRWETDKKTKNRLIPPVFFSSRKNNGDKYTSIVPPLISFHKGKQLDKSLWYKSHPFILQKAEDAYEFRFLWRTIHLKKENSKTDLSLILLWNSKKPEDKPLSFQFLGGLIAKDCNYAKNESRYRLFWFIPISKWNKFEN